MSIDVGQPKQFPVRPSGFVEVQISNSGFGDVDGTSVYLTQRFARRLEQSTNVDGLSLLEKLESGTLVVGLKHLIESMRNAESASRIIFTDRRNRKVRHDYYINLDQYQKLGYPTKLRVSRQAKVEQARDFLSKNFPTDFGSSRRERVADDLLDSGSGRQAVVGAATKLMRQLRREKKIRRRLASEPEQLQRASSAEFYQRRLGQFNQELTSNHTEHWWQKFIEANRWLFGTQHGPVIPKPKVGFDHIPDYLFPTLDGFIDILEIKRPDMAVVVPDRSHPRSFAWSRDANLAIGQVVQYLQEFEEHRLEIAHRLNTDLEASLGYRIQTFRPRAFILIGNASGMTAAEREGLRKLNYSLHGIDVLTYFDLILRGEAMVSLYKDGGTKDSKA